MSSQRSPWQICSGPRRLQPRCCAGIPCNAHPSNVMLKSEKYLPPGLALSMMRLLPEASHFSREEHTQMISTRGNGWLTTLAAVALVLVVAGCTTTQSPQRPVGDNAIYAAGQAELTGAQC